MPLRTLTEPVSKQQVKQTQTLVDEMPTALDHYSPGYVVDPRLEELLNREAPATGAVGAEFAEFVKCFKKHGIWITLDSEDLAKSTQEVPTEVVDGLSFVNVQFRSEQIRFPGCGGGSALFIGYAVGHRMVAGSIDVNAEWHDVKFKATEGNFYIGEQKLLGAQVMALMENCQAKVFDPVVAAPVKEFTR